jgi:predicted Zn-dependent protease with MMP-like domain
MGFLPPALRRAVANVVIFVVDHPERWIVEQEPWDPRLLGLFEGPTLAAERAGEGAGQKPHVYLFHRNLERAFPDAQGLAEQVRITLLHELGHYLGLDEGDLEERGLE